MNSSLATYVITTALNPQAGEVSHWAVVAEKPGRIRVQVTLQIKYLTCSTLNTAIIVGFQWCDKADGNQLHKF